MQVLRWIITEQNRLQAPCNITFKINRKKIESPQKKKRYNSHKYWVVAFPHVIPTLGVLTYLLMYVVFKTLVLYSYYIEYMWFLKV